MKLSSAAQAVLDEFSARDAEEIALQQTLDHTEGFARRDEFLLPVGKDCGEFLHTLILAKGARNILEIGTSYGYSTLFLADAARLTGGKVTTIELAEYKQQSAKDSLARAELAEFVNWECGDALTILGKLNQEFDFVLLDIWKELYIPCLECLYPNLAQGAMVVADNMLYPEIHRPDAEAYQSCIRNLPHTIDSGLYEIGSGLEISCIWRN